MGDADPFLIVLGLFRALEAAGDDLPDSAVDALYAGALAELDGQAMDLGWSLVAARLRQVILDHAETLGCDCGSLDWLEREQIHYAQRLPEE